MQAWLHGMTELFNMLSTLAFPPLCSCSLFRDPVSRARIGVVWDALEVASIWVQPWGLAHIGACRKPAGPACVLLALLLWCLTRCGRCGPCRRRLCKASPCLFMRTTPLLRLLQL